jgi:hypothetical protein
MLWPGLDDEIKLILEAAPATKSATSMQPNLENLSIEMLSLLRQQNAILSSPEKFFDPVVKRLQLMLYEQMYSSNFGRGRISDLFERRRTFEKRMQELPPSDDGPKQDDAEDDKGR